MGMTRYQREEWFMEFSQRENLDQLSSRERQALIKKLEGFTQRENPRAEPLGHGGTRIHITFSPGCDWRDVQVAHQRAKEGLATLLHEGKTTRWEVTFELRVTKDHKGQAKGKLGSGRGAVWYHTSEPLDAFTMEMGNILAKIGGRLRHCTASKGSGKCNKYFVLGRTDQKYCSSTCRMRVNMREKRAREKKRE